MPPDTRKSRAKARVSPLRRDRRLFFSHNSPLENCAGERERRHNYLLFDPLSGVEPLACQGGGQSAQGDQAQQGPQSGPTGIVGLGRAGVAGGVRLIRGVGGIRGVRLVRGRVRLVRGRIRLVRGVAVVLGVGKGRRGGGICRDGSGVACRGDGIASSLSLKSSCCGIHAIRLSAIAHRFLPDKNRRSEI